jgi:hypothetical protein
MLWSSVTAGLRILGFWQTYVVAAGTAVIMVVPKLFLALLQDRFMYGHDVPLNPTLIWYLIRYHWIDGFDKLQDRASKGNFTGGCTGLIVIGLAEFLGMYFAIATLLPLMLGTGTGANWSLPWVIPFNDTILFLKMLGVLLVATIILGQIPIVGMQLIYPLFVAVIAYFSGVTNTALVPNFWLGCGIILVGLAVKYAVVLILAGVRLILPAVAQFSRLWSIINLLLGPVLNLLPAFIYAGWISHQL